MTLCAVPFGLAVGALVPSELESVLILIGVVGVQLTLSVSNPVAKFLPFWGAQRLLNSATGGAGGDDLADHGCVPVRRRAVCDRVLGGQSPLRERALTGVPARVKRARSFQSPAATPGGRQTAHTCSRRSKPSDS